jgi:hypothetical protein
MTDREKYEMDMYMWGWDACLKGAKKENFRGEAGKGFADCEAGKPLPYWYNRWVSYRNRSEAYYARRAAA